VAWLNFEASATDEHWNCRSTRVKSMANFGLGLLQRPSETKWALSRVQWTTYLSDAVRKVTKLWQQGEYRRGRPTADEIVRAEWTGTRCVAIQGLPFSIRNSVHGLPTITMEKPIRTGSLFQTRLIQKLEGQTLS
jgi:hypothetical protein